MLAVAMPIPDAEHAVVSAEKVRDYLLNLAHPDGGTKAVWFMSVGYTQANWQNLAEDLLAIARDCEVYDSIPSGYGVKYLASGKVGRGGARPGSVVTVWIVESDCPPRLVTAYPGTLR